MAIKVAIEMAYAFDVKAKAAEVFDVLSDVPTSASFFPKLARLVDLGDDSFRWEMEAVGVGQLSLQTVYASRYRSDRKAGTVHWTPVEGVGNAQIGGNWAISAGKKATHIEFSLNAVVEVPLPGMMKMLITPVVTAENEKLVEQYIDNLIVRFGGEV